MLQDGTDPDRVELIIFGCGGVLINSKIVAPGKPAPDAFIHAAGMRVFGFTGKGHCSPDHGRRPVEAGAQPSAARP